MFCHKIICSLLLIWSNASLWSIKMTLMIHNILFIEIMLLNLIVVNVVPYVRDIDVFVWVLFINFHQMLLSPLKNLISDISDVPLFWSLLYLITYQRVFLKNSLKQELFFKLHGLYILLSCINEFTFFIEANIVVTDVRILVQLYWRIGLFLGRGLDHAIIADGNDSFLDEIHMGYFIFFI